MSWNRLIAALLDLVVLVAKFCVLIGMVWARETALSLSTPIFCFIAANILTHVCLLLIILEIMRHSAQWLAGLLMR